MVKRYISSVMARAIKCYGEKDTLVQYWYNCTIAINAMVKRYISSVMARAIKCYGEKDTLVQYWHNCTIAIKCYGEKIH